MVTRRATMRVNPWEAHAQGEVVGQCLFADSLDLFSAPVRGSTSR